MTKLRASSYVIYVDLPGNRDQWLLVHGYTGAYDQVSRDVVGYVRSLERNRVPKPLYGNWDEEWSDSTLVERPSDDTIAVLSRRGYLTERTHDEEVALFEEIVMRLHERQLRAMPSYILMPTYNCNLRCSYCFQDHMRTNLAYSHLLKPMSIEMADRIIAAFPPIEERLHGLPSESPRKRKITFFGGEPLLAVSRGVVSHFVGALSARGPVEFSAVTNGTEIDAYGDLLGPKGISSLQITIDGTAENHDRRRVHLDGSGSFKKIACNLDFALERGVRVSVRVNVDRHNAADVPRLAETFYTLGWSDHPRFSAYLAPVHDYAPAGLANEKAGSRPDFFNTWELDHMLSELHAQFPLTRVFSEIDNGLKSRAQRLFRTRGAEPPKAAFCGAHLGMYIFDAFGDIYACWDRTGDQRLRIGHLTDDGAVELNAVESTWRSRNVASNSTCKQCRFALNCGGGCAVLAEGASGSIFANYCDTFGKRFRAAVADAYLAQSVALDCLG
ncbi:MAG: radical SAM protein [Vulcanimicrobiaceae bacterium]